MQPHSISAMAVARYVFAYKYGLSIPQSAEVQISFKTAGPEELTKHIYHTISQIKPARFDRYGNLLTLEVTVKTNDGTPCTLKIQRLTDGEFKQGEKLLATHSVQHRAGLEEYYEVSRNTIRGFHRNSEKYDTFSCSSSNENAFVLSCKVKPSNFNFTKRMKEIPYTVSINFRGEQDIPEIEQKKKIASETQ